VGYAAPDLPLFGDHRWDGKARGKGSRIPHLAKNSEIWGTHCAVELRTAQGLLPT
jgi:hypothetical protein